MLYYTHQYHVLESVLSPLIQFNSIQSAAARFKRIVIYVDLIKIPSNIKIGRNVNKNMLLKNGEGKGWNRKSENRIQQNPKIDFYWYCKRNKKK